MSSSIDAAIAWGVDLGDEFSSDDLEVACKDGVGYEMYGDFYTGTWKAVVVNDSRLDASWCAAIDPAKLAPPTDEQVAALNRTLDALGFKGDRTPKLLLMASYG